MQPVDLFFRFNRGAFHAQAGAFQLDIEIFLAETGQRQRDAIMVIVTFFDVVRREALAFTAGLQRASQFIEADPLTQQWG